MTSTHRTTITAGIGQGLAVTALMAGIAFGATPIAVAERVWDLAAYDECVKKIDPKLSYEEHHHQISLCCLYSGGDWWMDESSGIQECVAPAPEAENVPGQPGPTEPPAVLQNPPGQTGPANPLIPVPRGPNSGTVGQT